MSDAQQHVERRRAARAIAAPTSRPLELGLDNTLSLLATEFSHCEKVQL